MKASVRFYVIISVLLGCFLVCGRNIGKAFDTDEEYTITVIGGHAEDDFGNIVKSAKKDAILTIVRDKEGDKYFDYWSSDGEVISKFMCFRYIMPGHDITIVAECCETQEDLVIDLTDGYFGIPYEERARFRNFFSAYSDQRFGAINMDLDKDGTQDVLYFDSAYSSEYQQQYSDPLCEISRDMNYSLGLSYKVSADDGRIGSITFVVDNEKAEFPVYDTSVGPFRILADNNIVCKAFDAAKYTYDTIVTEAYPGTRLLLTVDYSKIEDGFYLSKWEIEGLKCTNSGDYIMPMHDVTVRTETERQIPYTIEFTDDVITLPNDMDLYLLMEEAGYARIYNIEGYESYFGFDIDGNSIPDIIYDYYGNQIKLVSYDERKNQKDIILNINGPDRNRYKMFKYWPVTLHFPQEAVEPTVLPQPDPTAEPTVKPTLEQTIAPTEEPDDIPTLTPAETTDLIPSVPGPTHSGEASSKETKKFDAFLIIVPVAAILLAGGITAFLIMQRKRRR